MFKAGERRLRGQGGTGCGQTIEEEFTDGIVAQGVRIVRIFIASGNVQDTLVEDVF
jgi:hypothetical protein